MRARLNTGTAPSLQTQSEETNWATFATLGNAFGLARGSGWTWTSRLILATGPDGKYSGIYNTLTKAPTDVLFLALPKLATIDLDIVEVNPVLDVRNSTAELGTELVLSALGMEIL